MLVERRLLPGQWEFVRATDRYLLQSAGFGTGKTFGLCAKLLARASKKNAREGLLRQTLVSLKASTLKTLLEGDGDQPPMLPKGSYTHNKQDKIIRIKGGGEIVYFGLDDPANLGSLNLTGCAFDECEQVKHAAWVWAMGRCRVTVPGLPNQVYGATNPGPPSHWLVDLFGLALGKQAQPGHRVIRSMPEENHHLPADYIESLRNLTGLARKRYYLGEWAGSEGLVYENFDRETHVRERSGPWARTLIGIDEGFTNPFVCLLIRIDGDGRFHVEREHYQSKMTRDPKREVVKRFSAGEDIEAVIVDPSAAELIEVLRQDGHNVVEADNSVLPGIHRVRARLDKQADGMPRYTMDPACENGLREFESYEFKEGTDQPKKEMDHFCDCVRYCAAYAEGPTPQIVFTGGDKPYSVQSQHDALFGDTGWTTL